MVQVDKDSKLSDELKCHFFVLKSHEKVGLLLYIMQEQIEAKQPKDQTIIFAATRHHVEFLFEVVKAAGMRVTCIYGAMD